MSSKSSGSLVHALGQNWLGKTDIAVQTILLAVAFVVVGLRLWTRRRLRVSLQGNDWFILAATVIMLGRYIVELLLILLCGMGIHTDEVVRLGGSETLVRFNKLTYLGELLWVTVVALIQLSILQYYFRRFQQPIIMRLTCVLIGLCSTLWIASLLAKAFLCTPPHKVWLASVEGNCGDRKMLHTGCVVSELILNIFILLLPIPILRHMQFSRKGGNFSGQYLSSESSYHRPLGTPCRYQTFPHFKGLNLRFGPRISRVEHRDAFGYHCCLPTGAGAGQPKDYRDPRMHIDIRNCKIRHCFRYQILESNCVVRRTDGGTGNPPGYGHSTTGGKKARVQRVGLGADQNYIGLGNSFDAQFRAAG
ncbi:hypothetical protein N7481_011656 [Penicillium waksmanii]|uniref:uncharacterized protein n=1 Tax=Penicillium waksmanii TaxID=69791 RepID=UPI002546D36A|nr:uncharacterized protein N7481_011656 [Penicillium waksmanii]KAJ5974446.1 hypothetical protein N7481_011656 [Penicillium waksmanii]